MVAVAIVPEAVVVLVVGAQGRRVRLLLARVILEAVAALALLAALAVRDS